MKNICFLFLTFIAFQGCKATKYDCLDTRACRQYENNLETLSDFLFFEKPIKEANETWFGGFFEEVTGHKSNADMSYNGIGPPTLHDFKSYTGWYSINHDKLRYNR